jgi:hypothetical protein
MIVRVGSLAVLAAAVLALFAGPAAAGWRPPVDAALDADPAAHARSAVGTALAGVPYVAWTEGDERASQIRVARLGADGSWSAVGGSLNHAAGSLAIEPAIAAVGDTVYVAWAERATESSQFQVYVSRLAGTGFEPAGGSLNRSASVGARDPSIVDLAGTPYVAWAEPDAQNFEVVVARLDEAGWSAVGGLVNHSSRAAAAAGLLAMFTTQYSAEDPDLAVVGGVLHVAWSEQSDSGMELRVARLSDGVWREYGTEEAAVRSGTSPSQAELAAVGDVPFVAWREATGRFEVRAARLGDDGEWAGIGGGPVNPAGSAGDPSLLAVGGHLWLAVSQGGDVRVTRLDDAGTAWSEPVAAPLDRTPTNGVGAPSLFSSDGIPWVAWSEGVLSTRHDVRASRLVPDFLSTEVTTTAKSATFVSRLRTYGITYLAGFAWGRAGAGLPERTALVTAGGEETTIAATVTGLSRKTSYEVQPLALAGSDTRGEIVPFTTPKK